MSLRRCFPIYFPTTSRSIHNISVSIVNLYNKLICIKIFLHYTCDPSSYHVQKPNSQATALLHLLNTHANTRALGSRNHGAKPKNAPQNDAHEHDLHYYLWQVNIV